MILKNKFFAIILVATSTLNMVYADNKSDLLSEVSILETQLNTLKTVSTQDLETKVSTLSKSFDEIFASLWYDLKTVDYLVSLWKISSNFKNDLILELNSLNKEISEKTSSELNSLSAVKNNIQNLYSTVTDNEKTTLDNSITGIHSNYINLADSFSGKINTLNTKYTSGLNDYKNNVRNVYNSNTGIINTLNNFSSKYNELYTLESNFQKNYSSFKDTYLAFAGELTLFSEEKQKFYIDALKKELEKIRDMNMEANKMLVNHKIDIDRFMDILLENFSNSLVLKMNDMYGIIYSDTDISSIDSRFVSAKNRYYDLDGKLKASEVLTNTWALEEINFINEKLTVINNQIVGLIWTGSNNNSLSNIKIRLENEMVKFYNANYNGYREDLLLKLKEKLNMVALESKNTILAADTVNLRYSLLQDKISKSTDLNYINTQISAFKKDVEKYSYLNSDIINKKISTMTSDLNSLIWNKEISALKQELAQFKYNKMSQTKYNTQLVPIFSRIKSKFPDQYKAKLTLIVTKINTLLENKKLTNKNRFMLLCVKLNILNYVN